MPSRGVVGGRAADVGADPQGCAQQRRHRPAAAGAGRGVDVVGDARDDPSARPAPDAACGRRPTRAAAVAPPSASGMDTRPPRNRWPPCSPAAGDPRPHAATATAPPLGPAGVRRGAADSTRSGRKAAWPLSEVEAVVAVSAPPAVARAAGKEQPAVSTATTVAGEQEEGDGGSARSRTRRVVARGRSLAASDVECARPPECRARLRGAARRSSRTDRRRASRWPALTSAGGRRLLRWPAVGSVRRRAGRRGRTVDALRGGPRRARPWTSGASARRHAPPPTLLYPSAPP